MGFSVGCQLVLNTSERAYHELVTSNGFLPEGQSTGAILLLQVVGDGAEQTETGRCVSSLDVALRRMAGLRLA